MSKELRTIVTKRNMFEHEDHVLAIIVQLTMVSIFCDTCRDYLIMVKNKSLKVHLRDFTVERLTTE